MATKTISLSEDAYERLKALKRDDESFSDVVRRLTGHERDVWKGFSVYSDEAGERLRDAVATGRTETGRDWAERGGHVAGALDESDRSD